jgi:hypothetical protein
MLPLDDGWLDPDRSLFRKMPLTMIAVGDSIDSIRKGRRKAGIVLALGAALVAACGSPSTVYLGGAMLANFVYTDKLPTDYLAEFASGQECNFLKSQKDGGPLCRDSFERVVYEPPLYCYRTLGEIACYDKRDPDRRTTTEVR